MLSIMIKRNSLLYFKDKGAFFTSMITPMILLVLYVTFLANVYKDTLLASLPQGMPFDESLIDGCVSGQLLSALLAVCCVSVAFCSNLLMVQDKVTGSYKDLTVTPVKTATMALSYYLASFLETDIDALILGCTHYPLLRSRIREYVGEKITLVNPAYETAMDLKKLLRESQMDNPEAADEYASYKFYVSDAADKFKQFANSILPYDIEMTKQINIEEY